MTAATNVVTDADVLAELMEALNACLGRVSDHLYADENPTIEMLDRASAFLGKARALVRAFEEGPQEIEGGYVDRDWCVRLSIVDRDGDAASGWLRGAREWQQSIEHRAALVEACPAGLNVVSHTGR